jgi:hypothetical protein
MEQFANKQKAFMEQNKAQFSQPVLPRRTPSDSKRSEKLKIINIKIMSYNLEQLKLKNVYSPINRNS